MPPAEWKSIEAAKSGHEIDCHIGQRMRQQRVQQAISEAKLAEQLRITESQLRLFEQGFKRVPPRTLIEAAAYFKVSIGWFFEGNQARNFVAGLSGVNGDVARFLAMPEAYPLISAFIALKSVEERVAAVRSVRAMTSDARDAGALH